MTKNYWKVVNYASNYWENYITNYFMNDIKKQAVSLHRDCVLVYNDFISFMTSKKYSIGNPLFLTNDGGVQCFALN